MQRKKKVERNRKILGMFICVTLVLLTVLVLSLTVFFNIDTVKVQGDSIYEEAQIINASGISKGKNLFLCDVDGASAGICRNLPYISKATVTRKLPSTVVINITGDKAYFAVGTASGTALADREGKVLEFVAAEKVTDKIIKLNAGTVFKAEIGANIFESNNDEKENKQASEKAEALKTLFDAIKSSGLKDITAIDIKSASNIFITYQNRLKLNIGSLSDIEYKLKAAVEIIAKEDEAAPGEKGEIFLANTENIYVSPEQN